jgi:predicted nicotinamide N-methyase
MSAQAELLKAYDVSSIELVVNGRRFSFYIPRTIARFIHPDSPLEGFPIWAKIWQGGILLAGRLAEMAPQSDRHLLEVGTGLGVVGIVAAAFGHRVTLTENNPDALNFARANLEINSCPHAAIEYLDWQRPQLAGRFGMIIGSEVIYRKHDVEYLLTLFRRYLEPGGQVLLAESVRETGLYFWERMQEHFQVKVRKQTLRSQEDTTHLVLFDLQAPSQEKR